MNLLQMMAGNAVGGAERFFEDLVCALDACDINQHVAVRHTSDRAARLSVLSNPAAYMRFGGPFDLPTRVKIKKLVRQTKPDVVLTWMNRASDFCPQGSFIKVARLGGYYKLKHYRKHHYLIANSPGIQRYLIENGWSESRTTLIPNFAAPQNLPPASREKLSTPANATVLLALGRLHRNKALDTLIRAIPDTRDTVLWIAGAGTEEDALKELTATLNLWDRVRFLGWRNDPGALLKSADICVFPSRHEPFGNVIVQAWAHQTPLIAADCSGPREIVKNEEDALLFPVDDIKTLSDTITRLQCDYQLQEYLAQNGKVRHRQEFSRSAIVAQYLQFFERITQA